MIGVVADDVTGANDIGLMFAKGGYCVEVINEYKDLDLKTLQTDVIVLNTNSRCDPPEVAASKVYAATKYLLPLNCRLLVKKTCSVFRGNIGSEFDAMLEAAEANFAIAVAAFPKNGRITRNGQHYVHGKPLNESEFVNDPVHPMHINSLLEMINLQSARATHLLDYKVVAKGVEAIRAKVEEIRPLGGYLVADVTCQEDLTTLAQALADEPFIFGSSALAEELPKFWPKPAVGNLMSDLPSSSAGTLMIAGSVTPQTRSQIKTAKEGGIFTCTLDTKLLFTADQREKELKQIIADATAVLSRGESVLVHALNEKEEIEATQTVALEHGLGKVEASRIVSQTLGEIAFEIVTATGLNKLIVAGGETSGSVCDSLGIVGNRVLEEIEPGLPSGLSRGKFELLLVLKSGSFGTPTFLLKAQDHLERLAEKR